MYYRCRKIICRELQSELFRPIRAKRFELNLLVLYNTADASGKYNEKFQRSENVARRSCLSVLLEHSQNFMKVETDFDGKRLG